jgi:heme-degrading monooxygenase HmoA
MFLRVISGKLRPGTWVEFERAYQSATSEAGAIEGLCGRWLTRDLDDPDSGTTISLWTSPEAMRTYEASDALKNIIQPKLTPYFTGQYRTSRSEVRRAEGDPSPQEWVGGDN